MFDLHTHILPGLDDGAASPEEALQMAVIALAEGISAVVATPHVISGLYENTCRQIREAVGHLNRCLAEAGISLPILPGAEYLLEPDLPRRLREGELVTINDAGRYLLVELPSDLVPGYTEQLLYEIQLQGVIPILAHPERNPELRRNPERLSRLVKRGVLAQVTAGSICGRFGPAARRAAFKLLETGLAQVVASDAHSPSGRPPLVAAAVREIEAHWGADLARTVFSTSPRQICAGKLVEPVPRQPEAGFLARVFRSFSP